MKFLSKKLHNKKIKLIFFHPYSVIGGADLSYDLTIKETNTKKIFNRFYMY